MSRHQLFCIVTLAIVGAVALAQSRPARTSETESPLKWQPALLIQLSVADLDRSIRFYRDVLDFELELRKEELSWARIKPHIPGVTIGLGENPNPRGSGTVSMNFGVADVETARKLLEARGVEFLGPTTTIPNVVVLADFKDPDGNKIRLAGHPGS